MELGIWLSLELIYINRALINCLNEVVSAYVMSSMTVSSDGVIRPVSAEDLLDMILKRIKLWLWLQTLSLLW